MDGFLPIQAAFDNGPLHADIETGKHFQIAGELIHASTFYSIAFAAIAVVTTP